MGHKAMDCPQQNEVVAEEEAPEKEPEKTEIVVEAEKSIWGVYLRNIKLLSPHLSTLIRQILKYMCTFCMYIW